MIPETGTRKAFKQVLFEMFPEPKKGETWYFRMPLIPDGDHAFLSITIKHTTHGDVLYSFTSGSLANTSDMSVVHFVKLSVLGQITSSLR